MVAQNTRASEKPSRTAPTGRYAPVIDEAFGAELVGAGAAAPPDPAAVELSIKKATRALEADLIRRALDATGGNRTTAARLLEISHRALLYKIKEYGLGGPAPGSRN